MVNKIKIHYHKSNRFNKVAAKGNILLVHSNNRKNFFFSSDFFNACAIINSRKCNWFMLQL